MVASGKTNAAVPLLISLLAACGSSEIESDLGVDSAVPSDAAEEGSIPLDAGPPSDAATSTDARSDAEISQSDSGESPDAKIDSMDAASDAGLPTEVAYVSTYLGGVVALAIDPTSGSPTPLAKSPFDKGVGFYSLALYASGKLLYAVDPANNKIYGYRIGSDGGLTAISHSPFDTEGMPETIAVDPSGQFAYVGGNSISVYRIDPDSGSLAPISPSSFPLGTPASIAVSPNGFLYFTQSGFQRGIRAFAVDAASGAPTDEVEGSPFGVDHVIGGSLCFHPNGQYLYGGSLSGFTMDAHGKLVEFVHVDATIASIDAQGIDLAIDRQGQFIYGVGTSFSPSLKSMLSVFSIDPQTGKPESIAGSPFRVGAFSLYSVAADPAGRFVYVGSDDGQLSVLSPDATSDWIDIAHSPFAYNWLQPQVVIATLSAD